MTDITMKDDQLLRYSRHILLSEVDVDGQQAICNAHVMIIGLGGLGSPEALYLAAAGVGTLTLVDDDIVEESNLQRQIAHSIESVGQAKVVSAARECMVLNPDVILHAETMRADKDWLMARAAGVSLIVDCSDNAEVRYAINDACLAHGIPWVSGAAIAFSGQVAVFDPRQTGAPCYRCLYPALADEEMTCAGSGILSPVTGVVGALQATEALRLLVGFGQPQHGVLQTWDALGNDWRRWKITPADGCVCSGRG